MSTRASCSHGDWKENEDGSGPYTELVNRLVKCKTTAMDDDAAFDAMVEECSKSAKLVNQLLRNKLVSSGLCLLAQKRMIFMSDTEQALLRVLAKIIWLLANRESLSELREGKINQTALEKEFFGMTWRRVSFLYFSHAPCQCFLKERQALLSPEYISCDRDKCYHMFASNSSYFRCPHCFVHVYCSATCQAEDWPSHEDKCKLWRRYNPRSFAYVDWRLRGNDDTEPNVRRSGETYRCGTIYLPKDLLDRKVFVDNLLERHRYFEKLWFQRNITEIELAQFDLLEVEGAILMAEELSGFPEKKQLLAAIHKLEAGEPVDYSWKDTDRKACFVFDFEMTYDWILVGALQPNFARVLCQCISRNADKIQSLAFSILTHSPNIESPLYPSDKDLLAMALMLGKHLGKLPNLQTITLVANGAETRSTKYLAACFRLCRHYRKLYVFAHHGFPFGASFIDPDTSFFGRESVQELYLYDDEHNTDACLAFRAITTMQRLKKVDFCGYWRQVIIANAEDAALILEVLYKNLSAAMLPKLTINAEEWAAIFCQGLGATKIKSLIKCKWFLPAGVERAVAKSLAASSCLEELDISHVSFDSGKGQGNILFYQTLGRLLAEPCTSNLKSLRVRSLHAGVQCIQALLSGHARHWNLRSFSLNFGLDYFCWCKVIESVLADYVRDSDCLEHLEFKGGRRYEDSALIASKDLLEAVEEGHGCLNSIDFTKTDIFSEEWIVQMKESMHAMQLRKLAKACAGPRRRTLLIKALHGKEFSLRCRSLRSDASGCRSILLNEMVLNGAPSKEQDAPALVRATYNGGAETICSAQSELISTLVQQGLKVKKRQVVHELECKIEREGLQCSPLRTGIFWHGLFDPSADNYQRYETMLSDPDLTALAFVASEYARLGVGP
ncbi:hypothetical protein MPSEU_001026500 [Mayamaea pseudoterrestris]|nr:hypothetical protein MPSEU_001026500 [Mayamaea pseudoterrestris]